MAINMPNLSQRSPFQNLTESVQAALAVAGQIQGLKQNSEALERQKRKDAQEAEDRERNLGYEKEDRAFKGEERSRQKTEWSQKDEERQRTLTIQKEQDDPNSPLMQSVRAMGSQMGIKIPENVAYRQLQGSPIMTAIEKRLAGNEDRMTAGMKAKQELAKSKDPVQRLASQSGEVKTKVGIIADVLKDVTNYESAFASGESPQYLDSKTPLIGTFIGDNDLTKAARMMGETIGRLNSGGVIGKEEIPTFRAMLPRPSDDPEMQAQKIRDFRASMEARLTAFGFNPQELTALGFDAKTMGYDEGSAARRGNLGPLNVAAKSQKSELIPDANAAGPEKFTAEDLQAAEAVKVALTKNPQDPVALEAQKILRMKGLR
jgi:hypothetical protein